jgi:hypothetical protein
MPQGIHGRVDRGGLVTAELQKQRQGIGRIFIVIDDQHAAARSLGISHTAMLLVDG